MSMTLDYNNMMSEFIQHGITQHRLQDFADMARCAHGAVEANRGKGMQEWMLSPYVKSKDIKRILEVAAKARKFRNFVVLGIGGSALGPIAVFTALKHLYYNELPDEKRGGPRFYVVDNVDPERMNALFDVIDVEDTMFNVITKSGSTSETMSQYLIVMDMLTKKLGDKAAQHVVATTSESKGNLIKLAQLHGFFHFPAIAGKHPAGISVISDNQITGLFGHVIIEFTTVRGNRLSDFISRGTRRSSGKTNLISDKLYLRIKRTDTINLINLSEVFQFFIGKIARGRGIDKIRTVCQQHIAFIIRDDTICKDSLDQRVDFIIGVGAAQAGICI